MIQSLPLLFFALGALAAYGEQITVIGTIDKVAGNEIQVKTRTMAVTLFAGDRTVVRGQSPLKAGSEISARCERTGAGKLVAVRIWTNVVTFSATVRYIDRDDIEVMTSANSDSHREEHKLVHLHPDTAFGTNRKNLTVGQHIRVVGLDVENGAVDAARITIYNTDMPVTK